MTQPEMDQRDVDEAQKTLCALVVAGSDAAGVLQYVEAPFDQVAQTIQGPVDANLSIGQQCKLLSIARSSFYYTSKGETEQNLDLIRTIDKQFLETPFFGVRLMTWHLRNDGHLVNERRIRRLMRLMGFMPIYQKPNTSRPAKGHKTYPYLLKGLRVDRPDQV